MGHLFTEFEMPADETLSNRVRALLSGAGDIVEKKMFGGLAFLVQGNMSVGVHGSELIVRIDPAETDDALAEPGVRIFDITGRPMRGWLLVSAEAVSDEGSFSTWVERGVAYARLLPAKSAK